MTATDMLNFICGLFIAAPVMWVAWSFMNKHNITRPTNMHIFDFDVLEGEDHDGNEG